MSLRPPSGVLLDVTKGARVDGKFLRVGDQRFHVKGVAYGTFSVGRDGEPFPPQARMAEDLTAMAATGFNTVRTYTPPPDTLLDEACQRGLYVMAGLAWPQHVPFLDDPELMRRIREDAVATVRRLAAHPAVLLVALGNEISPAIVRWHGAHRIERFLASLARQVRAAAPDTLLTYVNFPPTEYLTLDEFDVCAYNIYLHDETDLRGYLARLQHIAGDKPLLLAEAGSDSLREGLDGQARLTAMQMRAAFEEGACGAVAYAWTDEWWRGGRVVDDWAFGLTDADRQPKPALAAVADVLANAPLGASGGRAYPRVSVVVCAHDAADTLDDCLTSLAALSYPDYEVIVVNDGSQDETGAIARRYPDVRVIDIPNGGLSAARNAGLAAATGDIVSYTDADCRVDSDWLTYLVQPMLVSDVVGAGGPNVVPTDDPWIAQCIALAPGGPAHVMLDDRIAEHVPGCNMAFRRESLLAIDGFNPVYLRAGDDVDICWRLQAKNLQVGFAPSALVWHHRRASVRAYWRQQVGYGEGETWLDAHHPEKFLAGQMVWRGRIYSPLPFLRVAAEQRVNTGVWGTAAFPSVYATHAHQWHYLPHTPAWMMASLVLLFVGVFGPLTGMDAAWLPLVAGTLGLVTTVGRCAACGWRSDLRSLPSIGRWSPRQSRLLYRGMIGWLHLIQPLARFRGQLRGLSGPPAVAPQHVTRLPWKTPMLTPRDALASVRVFSRDGRERSFWSESWTSHTALLAELVGVLRASRPAQVVDVDEGWRPDRDLSVAIGRWAWLRVRALVEEHADGGCLFRVQARLRPSFVGTVRGLALGLLLAGGTAASMALYRPSVSVVVSAVAFAAITARAAWQATRAAAVLDRAVTRVTTAAGMLPLPLPASPAPRVGRSAETTLSGS